MDFCHLKWHRPGASAMPLVRCSWLPDRFYKTQVIRIFLFRNVPNQNIMLQHLSLLKRRHPTTKSHGDNVPINCRHNVGLRPSTHRILRNFMRTGRKDHTEPDHHHRSEEFANGLCFQNAEKKNKDERIVDDKSDCKCVPGTTICSRPFTIPFKALQWQIRPKSEV